MDFKIKRLQNHIILYNNGVFSFIYQTADFKDKDSRLKSNLAEKLPKDPYW